MFALLRFLCFIFLFSISSLAKSQDKRVIELTLPLPAAFEFEEGELELYFPVSINYFITKKFSAGINIIGADIYIPVEEYTYTRADENAEYLLTHMGEEYDADRAMFGIGLNAKYYFITHYSLNAYVQADVNYLDISVWYQNSVGQNSGYPTRNEEGEFVSFEDEGPPVTEQTTVSVNLSAGVDFKINRRFAFYCQYQLVDIFKSIDLSYKEEAYFTNDPNHESGYDMYIDDVKYSNSDKLYQGFRYLQVGFRVYFGSKKL